MWPGQLYQKFPTTISNGNRTEWSPIRSSIIREQWQNRTTKQRESDLFITSMITDRNGRHEDTNYQLIIKITISKKRRIVKLWKKGKFTLKDWERMRKLLNFAKVVIGWFKLQLWMWLVDLNYNFKCDWLIELSDKILSNNKLCDDN